MNGSATIEVAEQHTFLELSGGEAPPRRSRCMSDSAIGVLATSSAKPWEDICDGERTSVGDDVASLLCGDHCWSTDTDEESSGATVPMSCRRPCFANPADSVRPSVPPCLRLSGNQEPEACRHRRVQGIKPVPGPDRTEPRADAGAEADKHEWDSKLPKHELTTVIFRSIPKDCLRERLVALLIKHGFQGCFDFVHVPVNFQEMAGLSHGLVNMINNYEDRRALSYFQGLLLSRTHVCAVAWSAPNQGLNAHIKRYRNSPMMHEFVPREYKPALYGRVLGRHSQNLRRSYEPHA